MGLKQICKEGRFGVEDACPIKVLQANSKPQDLNFIFGAEGMSVSGSRSPLQGCCVPGIGFVPPSYIGIFASIAWVVSHPSPVWTQGRVKGTNLPQTPPERGNEGRVKGTNQTCSPKGQQIRG